MTGSYQNMKSHHLSVLSWKFTTQCKVTSEGAAFSQPCQTAALHPSRGPLKSRLHEKAEVEPEYEVSQLLQRCMLFPPLTARMLVPQQFHWSEKLSPPCSLFWTMFCRNCWMLTGSYLVVSTIYAKSQKAQTFI